MLALCELFANLPASLQEQMVDDLRVGVREFGDDVQQVWALSKAIPALGEPLRRKLLEETLKLVQGIGDDKLRAEAWRDLMPLVPESEWPPTIAEVRDALATPPLVPAARHVVPERLSFAQLRTALAEACSVNSGLGGRAELLAQLAPAWLKLPADEQYRLWRDSVRQLSAQRERADFLSDLGVLAPVIQALGGARALQAVSQAIERVCRWFP